MPDLVDLGQVVDLVNRVLLVEDCVRNSKQPHIRGLAEGVVEVLGLNVCLKALPARVYLTNGLLQTLLERTTNSHDFTDGLHARAEEAADAVELLEVPARDLDDTVVQARLEARAGDLRDRVLDLVQRDAEAELCRDEGQWVASCFGGES